MRKQSSARRQANDDDSCADNTKMISDIYKCTVSHFSIKDAFDIVDVLFEKNYISVSCAEKDRRWIVEILDNRPIIENDIRSLLSNYKLFRISCEKLEEIDWLKKCFENFRPIVVNGFYIYGPHLRNEIMPPNKICIEIAAATAFGTGEHPTTNRCLAACQTFFDYRKHRAVLDIGCGSGILSIALAKLGAEDVIACDNDAEAVKITQENIVINKTEHRISVFQNQCCEFARKQYDFIVANILAEPLISMSNEIVRSLANNGLLILSGFTSDDDSALQKYSSSGLILKHTYNYNGWATVVLQKLV